MKRFELVIEDDGDSCIMSGTNEGFNVLELIALLDVKKIDLMEQFTKRENFTHHRVVKKDGEEAEIQKVE